MSRNFRFQFFKSILIRLLSSVLTLILFVSFIFFLVRLSPGNPTEKYISAKLGTVLSESISEKFSINKPVIDQYLAFVSNLFTGEFGISYNYHLPVFDVVWEYFSFTIVFVTISFIIQVSISLWLAVRIVRSKIEWIEKFLSGFSLFIYSIPAFVLGVSLIYVFSIHLNLVPISGLKSLDYEEMSFFQKILDQTKHLILPLVTLSAAGVALFYKYI